LEKTFLFRQNNGASSPLTCISVGPKGKFVVCGNTASDIFVVDTKNGKLKETILGHDSKISGVSFVQNRFHILSCSWDATTRLWDSKEKGNPLILKHGSEVKALTVSHALGKGVAGDRDGELKIFSLSTMKNLRNITAHDSGISGLTILDNDIKLVTSSWSGECKLWNLASYELEKEIVTKGERIQALAATPDGSKIALGMHSGKILLINLETPSERSKLVGHTDIVEALSIDSTGERLVSGSWDRTIRLWSLNTNKEISSGNLLSGITAVEWDPKDEIVYSTDFSGSIISWSI